jgi:hypothetical protein
MWEKWVFIAALGASTCLLRGSTGDILGSPRGRDLILTILNECAAVANAEGHAVRPEALEQIREKLTDRASSLTSSMYRDLQNGAPLEADAILGDMCARGEAKRLELLLLNAAFAQLSIYEMQRKSTGVTIPEELRAGLDAYRKETSSQRWTELSQLPVNGMDVLDALQRIKPEFPDPLPLPVEDIVQDSDAFFQWATLPNPDDVLTAIIDVLAHR